MTSLIWLKNFEMETQNILPHCTRVRKGRQTTHMFDACLQQKKVCCSTPDSLHEQKAAISPAGQWTWSLYRSLRSAFIVHAQSTAVASDVQSPGVDQVTEEMIDEFFAKDTGRDRLQRMFFKSPFEETSEELEFVYTAAFHGGLLAFCLRGYLGGKTAQQKFIAANRATTFATRFQASRKMHEAVWLGMMGNGLKAGLAIGTTIGLYVLISQSIAVYRRRSSVMEYSVAGGVCGALYRINYGPKGMIAGAGFGSIFGLVGAVCILGLLKLTGHTQEERSRRNIVDTIVYERNMNRYQCPEPSKERVYCK